MMESSIGEIIKISSSLDETLCVFSAKTVSLNIDTKCILLNEDQENFNPFIAEFERFLSIYEINDVIENLKEQIPNPDVAMMIRAIQFYKKNDAFIKI